MELADVKQGEGSPDWESSTLKGCGWTLKNRGQGRGWTGQDLVGRGEALWVFLCFVLFLILTETGKHTNFQSRRLTESGFLERSFWTSIHSKKYIFLWGLVYTAFTQQLVSLKQYLASLAALWYFLLYFTPVLQVLVLAHKWELQPTVCKSQNYMSP